MESENPSWHNNFDNLAFQDGAEHDANISVNFDLDPTVANIGPTEVDPTLVEVKTRKPRVKLTAEKLLSRKGLPYVMENGPKRCRISKRRNPYENLTSVLQFYQLWAHELFPKAKFKDFVSLCHTLGKGDKELREYRTNLVKKDMGILLEDSITSAYSERPEHVEEQRTGDIPSTGLFLRDDDESGLVGNQSPVEQREDDDLLYTSSHATEKMPADLRDTQDSIEDHNLDMLREMQQLEEMRPQQDVQSDEELTLMREMDNI